MDIKSKMILALVTIIVFLSGCIAYQKQYYSKELLKKDNAALQLDNSQLEKNTQVANDKAATAVKNAAVSLSVTKELRVSKDKALSAAELSAKKVDEDVFAIMNSDKDSQEKQHAASSAIIDELQAFSIKAIAGV